MTELCAIVLAAGEGTRLRPLTELRPKALCPVGNVALLDLALARLAALGLTGADRVAVNACHLAGQVVAHVGDRAHVTVEPGPKPLGTSGGVGNLRDWVAGRPVLLTNADAYLAGGDLTVLTRGWDGERVRILGVPAPPGQRPEFGGHVFAGYSLLPWRDVARLEPRPAEIVRTVWRPAEAAGRLDVVEYGGRYVDTGTPRRYLDANLDALHGAPVLVGSGATVTGSARCAVIGDGARVYGRVRRAVVWPGGFVGADEQLVDAIRAGRELTVPAS
ncbi:MAG TPA: NTP transferase domain-containing protein [Micromonosporaceae bacterium]